ncbi:MAG TPA: hypothetical protein VFY03_05235, partial [Woeseiaceae bacterium]|nr:hypothetical protein [Woeseiaceae bacterium]
AAATVQAARLRAQPAAAPAFAELLVDELSRVAARAYSEEGIPMYLAGEDLAGGRGAPAGFEPGALNARLAGEFRDYAAELPGLDRERTEYDAAMLVELLALRDFQTGGS